MTQHMQYARTALPIPATRLLTDTASSTDSSSSSSQPHTAVLCIVLSQTLWPLRTAWLIIWHSEPAQWHHTGQNLIDAIWTSSSTVCAAAGRGRAVIWPQALSGKQLYPLRRHPPSVGRPLKRLWFLCCSCNLIHSDVGLGRMQQRPQAQAAAATPTKY